MLWLINVWPKVCGPTLSSPGFQYEAEEPLLLYSNNFSTSENAETLMVEFVAFSYRY